MLRQMSGFRSTRRALRATIVAIAVLVLVPAWMARVTYLYSCPGSSEVRKTTCCKAAAKRQADPIAKPACCDVDAIDLGAPRTPASGHDTAAVAPPDVVAIAIARPEPRAPHAPAARPTHQATGPPPYLRNLTLLL